MAKKQGPLSLSAEAWAMIEEIRKKMGVSRNSAIEILIRERAERDGIKVQVSATEEEK